MNEPQLRLEYIPLPQVLGWDWLGNPKKHDLNQLAASIRRYGFQDPPKFEAALGGFSQGNGRVQALRLLKEGGDAPPLGIALLPAGEWVVPVLFGNDLPDQATAAAFAVDHNNLNLGGHFDALDTARLWDAAGYTALLAGLNDQAALPVTVNGETLDALLARLAEPEPAGEEAGLKAAVEGDDNAEPQADTIVSIGRYQFKLSRADYFALIEDIRQRAGFAAANIHAEIARRLGLPWGETAEAADGR